MPPVPPRRPEPVCNVEHVVPESGEDGRLHRAMKSGAPPIAASKFWMRLVVAG